MKKTLKSYNKEKDPHQKKPRENDREMKILNFVMVMDF